MTKQVLLINITRMGDLVQMGTLLRRLQHEWPGAAVDLVVDRRFAPVAALLPHLRHIVTYDFHRLMEDSRVRATDVVSLYREVKSWAAPLVEAGYDRVVNLTFNRRSGFLTSYIGAREIRGVTAAKDGDVEIYNPWMAYLTDMHNHRRLNHFNLVDIYAMGGSGPGPFAPLSLTVPADAAEWATGFFAQRAPATQEWIAVQVGASDPMKAWRADSFGLTLAAISKQARVGCVFIGTEDERSAIEVAQRRYREAGGIGPICEAVGRTSLPQLAGLLARCRLLLTNDTGPMHVAVAVGTPVVDCSVGHVDLRETGPYGPGHWVIQPDMACAPCGFDQICFHHACKELLVPEQVAQLCLHILRGDALPARTSGIRLYESASDEDGLGSYRLQVGREDPSVAWYGQFWRRFWFLEFTGHHSKLPPLSGAPPDLPEARKTVSELTVSAARLTALAAELVTLSGQRPLPVRELRLAEANERAERLRALALSKHSPATTPLGVALLRDVHSDEGEGVTAMAQSRLATYRRWEVRLKAVEAVLPPAPPATRQDHVCRTLHGELARSA